MDDDDLTLEAFAEIQPDRDGNIWQHPVTFKGECLLGCKGRRMLNTKNWAKAQAWIEYHRSGLEHVEKLLKRRPVTIEPMRSFMEGVQEGIEHQS